MRRGRAAAVAAAVAVAVVAPQPAPRAGFEDPLDVPARRSPLAARRPLAAVAAAGDRLVAVGQRGHVLTSGDGGRSWDQAAVPVSADLTAVRFVSPERGWAVGHDGVVLATLDGGRSWALQLDGRRLAALLEAERPPAGGAEAARLAVLRAQGAGLALLDVWFAEDGRSGFAVGAFDLVVHTQDGGARWVPWVGRTDNPRGLHLHALARAGGEVYAVGEQGLVLRLDAAARRFRAVPSPWAGSLFGVVGRGGEAVAFGLRGRAFRGREGGARWEPLETGVEAALTAGTVMPDGRIVLGTQAGDLLVAGGDGRFRRVPRDRPLPVAGLAPAGADGVVAVGAAGVGVEPLR